jgi:hypothetical protein
MDREDAPISRRDWKEATRALLAADPVITASVGGSARKLFGEEQSFKVIYCRLAPPELLLTQERAVVNELLSQYPYALFVFSDQAQKRFHFLNVKDEPQGQKRRLFRRITVGNGERLRTAAEQLAKLDGEALKHLPLSGIQARFDEAFDVGPATKRFLRSTSEYSNWSRLAFRALRPIRREKRRVGSRENGLSGSTDYLQ